MVYTGRVEKPKVGVIIVNHDQKDLLRACLQSWQACDYQPMTLLVSDNASSDGAVEMLRLDFPSVMVLAHPRELGFAGAAKAGMDALAASCELLFLTTNDTVVDRDMLSHLVEAAEQHPEAAVFGPKIVYFAERGRLWHAGCYLGRWLGNPGHYGLLQLDDGTFDTPRSCDFVTGCGFLTRSRPGQAIGFLNPEFGFYAEDSDYCLRLREQGWDIRYVPNARMAHRISATLGSNSPLSAYYSARNHLRVLWESRWGFFPLTLLLYSALLLGRYVPLEFKRGLKPGWSYARNVLLGMRDFLLRRWGMRDPSDVRKPFPL